VVVASNHGVLLFVKSRICCLTQNAHVLFRRLLLGNRGVPICIGPFSFCKFRVVWNSRFAKLSKVSATTSALNCANLLNASCGLLSLNTTISQSNWNPFRGSITQLLCALICALYKECSLFLVPFLCNVPG